MHFSAGSVQIKPTSNPLSHTAQREIKKLRSSIPHFYAMIVAIKLPKERNKLPFPTFMTNLQSVMIESLIKKQLDPFVEVLTSIQATQANFSKVAEKLSLSTQQSAKIYFHRK